MASFAVLIKSFCRERRFDYLFIEPAGMVTTQELESAASSGLRDCRYQIGPFITLVDAMEFEASWAERRQLLLSQIAGADIVGITKADLIDGDRRSNIVNELGKYTHNLVEIRASDSETLMKILENIENKVRYRTLN